MFISHDQKAYIHRSEPYDFTHWYVGMAALSADSFVTVGQSGDARRWEAANLRPTDPWNGKLLGQCIATQNNWVVTGTAQHTVRILRDTESEVEVLTGHKKDVYGVSIKGTCVLSGAADHSGLLWRLSDSGTTCAGRLLGHQGTVMATALKETTAITSSADKTVRIWDIGNDAGVCTSVLLGHTDQVNCLALTDHLIYSGSRDRTIRLWDNRKAEPCIGIWAGHNEQVSCMTISSGGLMSGSDDHTVRLWHGDGRSVELDRHDDKVWSLAVLDTGALISGSAAELHSLALK